MAGIVIFLSMRETMGAIGTVVVKVTAVFFFLDPFIHLNSAVEHYVCVWRRACASE